MIFLWSLDRMQSFQMGLFSPFNFVFCDVLSTEQQMRHLRRWQVMGW